MNLYIKKPSSNSEEYPTKNKVRFEYTMSVGLEKGAQTSLIVCCTVCCLAIGNAVYVENYTFYIYRLIFIPSVYVMAIYSVQG